MIEKLPIADKALPGEKDKTKSPFPHERNEDFSFISYPKRFCVPARRANAD